MAAHHDPWVLSAVVSALDSMADVIPALLTLGDGRMATLQLDIEAALLQALKPLRPGYGKPSADRTTGHHRARNRS